MESKPDPKKAKVGTSSKTKVIILFCVILIQLN